MRVRPSHVLAASMGAMLTGCTSYLDSLPAHVPAQLAEQTPDDLAVVEAAVSRALHGLPVRVDPSAFGEGGSLVVEVLPALAALEVEPERGGPASATFAMRLQGGRCELTHLESGRSYPLEGVACRPARHEGPEGAAGEFASEPEPGAETPLHFTPADFTYGPRSLFADLTCPAGPAGAVVVFCQAQLDATGHADPHGTYCFGQGSIADSYAWRAERLAEDALFAPARVADRPVPVLISYRLFFDRGEHGCRVEALRNLGFQQDALGLHYVAPQEILSDGGWLGRMKRDDAPLFFGCPPNKSVAFVMSAPVSVDGAAGTAALEHRNPALLGQFDPPLHALERSRFVPGVHGGRPRAMRYYDFLYLER